MTAIAAVVQDGEVWMGGDSAGVAGLSIVTRRDPKVFQAGPFLIGYTSSFRMGQILRFGDSGRRLSDPDILCGCENIDPYEAMVTRFVPWVREQFKQSGFATKHCGAESGGTFIVGFRGRLFDVEDDYQVGELHTPFASVGCGSDIVLGSLFTTERQKKKLPAKKRIEESLLAACEFSAGVRGPFVIRKLTVAAQPPTKGAA